jgi:hypothetical protein
MGECYKVLYRPMRTYNTHVSSMFDYYLPRYPKENEKLNLSFVYLTSLKDNKKTHTTMV